MFTQNITSKALLCASILIAITVPSLIFGRAMIGVVLGLALLLILISSHPKITIVQIKNSIPIPLKILLLLAVIASAINIPFSLRVDLSIEAWARTWVLLAVITFVAFSVEKHLDLIFKIIPIAFLMTIIAYICITYIFIDEIHPKANKLLLNGLMLLLPLNFYMFFKYRSPFWCGLALLNVFIFTYCASQGGAKASIAGIAIMIVSFIILTTLKRFSVKQTIMVSIGIMGVSSVILFFWLSNQVNFSSRENIEVAFLPVWLVDMHRQLIWVFSFDLFQSSPWVGYGLNASNHHPDAQQLAHTYFVDRLEGLKGFHEVTVLPSHPHSWIMEMLLDGGLIATIPLFALIIYSLFLALRAYCRTYNSALFIMVVTHLVYWGTGLFNFSFWSTWWQASFYLTSMILLSAYLKDKPEISANN